jgi:hypothetical protein
MLATLENQIRLQGFVTEEQIKDEHRERVVHACRLAVNHAALLCGAMTAFVERLTSDDALSRPDSLVKVEDCKLKLDDAELHLILAVEKLYRLHRTKKQVGQAHYLDLLTFCWNGVGECLDRRNDQSKWEGFDGPFQSGEQKYQHDVVLPLIRESLEIFRAQQRILRSEAKVAAGGVE